MKTLFSALVFVLSIQSVKAEDMIIQRFRGAAVLAVNEARSKGIQSIDGIELADIETAAKTVNIIYQKGLTVHYGSRRCAIWQNSKDMLVHVGVNEQVKMAPHIFLNQTCADLDDSQLKGVALHEVLGVTYGADKKYEVSTRILTGNSILNGVNLKSKNLRTSGGSTGIGGGGDYDDLKFKLAGLRQLEIFKSEKIVSYAGYTLEVLAEKLLLMDISAASNVLKSVEYRGPGVEQTESKTYILSQLYRSQDESTLGILAVLVSVLEAGHGLDGFVTEELKKLILTDIQLRL